MLIPKARLIQPLLTRQGMLLNKCFNSLVSTIKSQLIKQ